MPTDIEVLNAVENLNIEQKLTPEVHLGYNAADDLVEIKKIIDSTTYLRLVDDPDVADKTVDKWVKYGVWSVI